MTSREVMIVRKYFTGGLIGFAFIATLSLGCAKESLYADTSYSNPRTDYEAIVQDDADLFTDSEEEDLCELLESVTEYCNAAVVTIDYNPHYNTQSYAESYSDDEFSKGNAVVFVVDMDNRYLYLDSSGAARKRITSAYADTITDNVYRYASDSDYYTCAYKTFEQVYALMKGQRIAQPMKYISNTLLAVALAMLINFIAVSILSGKRKATRNELLSGIYSSFKIHDAAAVFTHQTKTYSPQSSGGSGGGSSGGGGGGGGGGHSGGGHIC